ncbi:hypothetical protein [Helicobacter fennelliae]|uniref:hypothetical protein n=1 Tax=Helicobacter fennelliae TaxID=215 RepID=UPI000E08922E|nr:hypothetical protein [Helicobacter fennelliae]STQ83719.1 Uncharacterised protein [Helicobacter fennelliae]
MITKSEVRNALDEWQTLENGKYRENELALIDLVKHYKSNDSLKSILLKIATLNEFYSTNIKRAFSMANHILKLDIDTKLKALKDSPHNELRCCKELVHSIANLEGTNFISFASKYCSFHNQELFPIFDNLVAKVLCQLQKSDNFSDFNPRRFANNPQHQLRDYAIFKKAILDFINFYDLKDFNFKEIDRFLWQKGRKEFGSAK